MHAPYPGVVSQYKVNSMFIWGFFPDFLVWGRSLFHFLLFWGFFCLFIFIFIVWVFGGSFGRKRRREVEIKGQEVGKIWRSGEDMGEAGGRGNHAKDI